MISADIVIVFSAQTHLILFGVTNKSPLGNEQLMIKHKLTDTATAHAGDKGEMKW